MSTISDKVLEELIAGKSPTEVRAHSKSVSKFTKGVQDYLAWAIPEVSRLQSEIASLNNTQKKLNGSIESLQARQSEFNQEIHSLSAYQKKLEEDVQEKSSRLQQLQSQVKQTEDKLKELRLEIQRLEAKGYTNEILLKLTKFDAASGEEMLQRIQSIEKYKAEILSLQRNKESLDNENEEMLRGNKELKAKIQEAQDELSMVNDRLRKRQDEERLFETSMKVTEKLILSYGLKDVDFENMYSIFQSVGTPGMPGRTMENVKETVEMYHTLTSLEAAINGRKETLNRVEAELSKTEERLAASTKAFMTLSKRIEQLIMNIEKTAKNVESDVMRTLRGLETEAQAKVLKETQDAIKIIRDEATSTGEMMAKLEVFAPAITLISRAEGRPSDIFPAMHLICQRFKSWLLKNPPTQSILFLVNNINSIILQIEGEMKR